MQVLEKLYLQNLDRVVCPLKARMNTGFEPKVDIVDIGKLIFINITNFQQGGSSDGAQPQGLKRKL